MLNVFSLRSKLTVLITMLVLGITGSVTYLSIEKEKEYYEHYLQQEGELFLDTVDVMLRNSLYSLNVNEIIKQVRQFQQHQTIIQSLHVFDKDGRLIIDSEKKALEFNSEFDSFGQKIIDNQQTIYQLKNDYLIAAKPILFGDRIVGAITIQISTKPLQEKIITLRNQGIAVIFLAGFGGILIAIFISYSLTTPLEKLMKATHRISEGEMSYRIKLKNKDEFAILADEFNHMTEHLQETLHKYEQTNAKLQYDITHDNLTGLANRVFILDQLKAEIEKKKQNPEYLFAVLFLDCDRFKIINDSLGHDVGDQVLITIAKRMNNCIKKNDIAARLGGDEFVIILENITHEDQVIKIANRILNNLNQPLNLDNQQLVITVSIGVVISKKEYDKPDDLLRDADITMYHAKQKGKAQYAIFQPIMQQKALQRLEIETSLRQALENQEFHLYYQPIISLATSELLGFEALLRWHHPIQGWISPSEFIPIAEETGLIVPLGEWILQEACQQISIWQDRFPGFNGLKISVNISSHQISQPNFVEQVQHILQNTKLKASDLNLEITETILMNNIESASFKLQCLQSLGIKISIDDFGTGYSSLNYLQQLPIDVLKIDRNFVARLESNPDEFQIIEAIIRLGEVLGMKTLAEGIETPEQCNLIKSLGVNYGQGFLFSKPLNKNLAEQTLYSSSEPYSSTWKVNHYETSTY